MGACGRWTSGERAMRGGPRRESIVRLARLAPAGRLEAKGASLGLRIGLYLMNDLLMFTTTSHPP